MPNREQMFMYKDKWMSLSQIQKVKETKTIVKEEVITPTEELSDSQEEVSNKVNVTTNEETLEVLSKKYKEKLGKLPPVNKKNDINWIKNKLNN